MKLKFKLKFCEFKEILCFATDFSNSKDIHKLTLLDKINLKNFLYHCHKRHLDFIIKRKLADAKILFTFDINQFQIVEKIILMHPQSHYSNAILFSMQIERDKQIQHFSIVSSSG